MACENCCATIDSAPINRTWSEPISHPEAKEGQHGRYLDLLDSNLAVFGKDDAQVLEYWLDASLFSSCKRDARKKLPWCRDVFLQDIAAYADHGIRDVTSFAAYMDGDCVRQYGEPPLHEYGVRTARLPHAMRSNHPRAKEARHILEGEFGCAIPSLALPGGSPELSPMEYL